ncbi:MAG: PPC domain-containing protein [Candidatus Bathyarchaeia archaeon]
MLKDLKIALLLSVILPLGLLATFRLGGILKEPLTISENKTLKAVSWSMERPIADINIKDSLIHIYNEDILVNSTIFIDDYDVNSVYGGSDCITTQVNITASISEGFISLINITFWEKYESSQVDFFASDAWPKCFVHIGNLSIIRHDDFLRGNGLKAFVELEGANFPNSVSFGCFANWILRSPKNYTNQLKVRFELIYFNGTAYKKVVQPFMLLVGPDNNNSFETASEISVGKEYSRLYIGPNDVDDYYKVYLNEGQTLSIHLLKWLSPPVAKCDLVLYNPNGKLATYSVHNYTHTITYPINSSGYWFIRVHWLEGFGFYTLSLETNSQGR